MPSKYTIRIKLLTALLIGVTGVIWAMAYTTSAMVDVAKKAKSESGHSELKEEGEEANGIK